MDSISLLRIEQAFFDALSSNNDDANYIEDKERFIEKLTGKPPEDLE